LAPLILPVPVKYVTLDVLRALTISKIVRHATLHTYYSTLTTPVFFRARIPPSLILPKQSVSVVILNVRLVCLLPTVHLAPITTVSSITTVWQDVRNRCTLLTTHVLTARLDASHVIPRFANSAALLTMRLTVCVTVNALLTSLLLLIKCAINVVKIVLHA
jgi:hypothetical protein